MSLTVEEYNRLLKEHGTVAGIARATGRNERSLRRWIKSNVKQNATTDTPPTDTKGSFEYKANGDSISERIIEISHLGITPELMMEKMGLKKAYGKSLHTVITFGRTRLKVAEG